MDIVFPIALVVVTVVAMEVIAYLLHRYVMHGWGWGWHRSHHEEREGWFERNDLYGILFAVLAIGLFVIGMWVPAITWIATGMTVYGALYFIFHDGLVHQRWPFRHLPRRGYLKRLYQAHRMHHAVHERDGAVSFGFLYAAPVDTLANQLQQQRSSRIVAATPELRRQAE